MQYPQSLKKHDQICVIAPSRPILLLQKDIQKSAALLKQYGFQVIFGRNMYKKFFYSAGTVKERLNDFQKATNDPNTKFILCATGGASSNQLLEHIDFLSLKKHPKLFLGYSDNTALLLAIYAQTGMPVFHGPDMTEYFHLSTRARNCLFNLLCGEVKCYRYPKKMKILRPGKTEGVLLGGNLTLINSLLGTPYTPDYKNAILFWEETGDSPAMIHFKLQQLRLSGFMKHLAGMVVGYISNYTDKKHPEDFRKIDEIIQEVTNGYHFPIIHVDYFGHGIDNFLTFPIGACARIDTTKGLFMIENPLK